MPIQFRHSQSWLDHTGAPPTVLQELIRHASIWTMVNVYGKARSVSASEPDSTVLLDFKIKWTNLLWA